MEFLFFFIDLPIVFEEKRFLVLLVGVVSWLVVGVTSRAIPSHQ
jgi:hypothetical protein